MTVEQITNYQIYQMIGKELYLKLDDDHLARLRRATTVGQFFKTYDQIVEDNREPCEIPL